MRRLLLCGSLFCALAACTSTDPAPDGGGTKPGEDERSVPVFAAHTKDVLERRWTDRFATAAILVADEIEVTGPPDLTQHIAVTQDPQVLDFTTRTVPDGLVQVTSLKEGVMGVEIRAQLDAWTIVAMKRLRVLQRPSDAPVTIRANGAVLYRSVDGEEQRAPTMTVRGEHTR